MAQAKKTWSRRRKIGVGVLAALVVLGIAMGIFVLTRPPRSTGTQTSTITATATRKTEQLAVGMTGTLAPQQQADLRFGVSGQVTVVHVKAGDTVTTGQALAAIDSTSLENSVTLAKANLTSAQANYDQVSTASASTTAQINAASAQVTSARANLNAAETNLANATLRSTMDGTVASVSISVGDQVTAGGSAAASATATATGQIVVISTHTWKVNASVGAADLATLAVGQPATVTPTGSSTKLAGTVASVGIVASTSSGGSSTFPVEITLTEPNDTLYSGSNVDVTVVAATYPDVLVIPTAAIRTVDNQAMVDVSANGTTVASPVTVGRVFGAETEIVKGLKEGDVVVITITRTFPTTRATGGFGPFGGGSGGGQQEAGQGTPTRSGG